MLHKDLILKLAEERGMEFNQYLEQQVMDSVCDGACLNCGYTELDWLEPDARDIDCPDCFTPNVYSSVELALGGFF